MFEEFEWLNEPARWSAEASRLTLVTDANTDFWQTTFYGFERDSGHALLRLVQGDFSFEAAFTGRYEQLYDQAGVMLRIDARNWIKTGIEYTDGLMHFSVVVTRERSDWSVIPLPDATPADEVRVRLTRHGDAVRIQYAVGDGAWRMARLCPFTAEEARVGVMACSPERAGFEAEFRQVRLGPAIDRKLHD
jgi:hypothetical protein